MIQALVIGCGVMGLSSAIRLLENDYKVKIISRDLPQATSSAVAGAIWAGRVGNERQKVGYRSTQSLSRTIYG